METVDFPWKTDGFGHEKHSWKLPQLLLKVNTNHSWKCLSDLTRRLVLCFPSTSCCEVADDHTVKTRDDTFGTNVNLERICGVTADWAVHYQLHVHIC